MLGHKYGAEGICSEGTYQLKKLFPDTIVAWDTRLQWGGDGIQTSYDPRRDCIGAANLGRTLGLPSVHAVALYDCCQMSGEAAGQIEQVRKRRPLELKKWLGGAQIFEISQKIYKNSERNLH